MNHASAMSSDLMVGVRNRSPDTRVGSLQLWIPKLCQGSYFPPILKPRKLTEKALVAVIQG